MSATSDVFSNRSNEIPLGLDDMVADLQAITGNALIRVGSQLYWRSGRTLEPVDSHVQLFARIYKCGRVIWGRGMTKEEFFEGLRMGVPNFSGASDYPHFPSFPGVLYLSKAPSPANTGRLDELIGRFNPATDVDRVLMKAFVVTVFWGGPWGKRPMFTFTADAGLDRHRGRGTGKTTFVELCAGLVGGVLNVHPTADVDRTVASLLSPDALKKRVVLIDNLKSNRFSSDFFERFVTARMIGGHRLYTGFAERANDLTVAVTVNAANYSKDMAERTVVVKLAPPQRSVGWFGSVTKFIREHRAAIIADVAWLMAQRPRRIDTPDRWEVWTASVLSRVADPNPVLAELDARREEIDDDVHAAALYQDHVEACIVERVPHADVRRGKFFIPSPLLVVWLRKLSPELGVKGLGGVVGTYMADRLCYVHKRTSRGYVWTGEDAEADAPVTEFSYEVERRR